MKVPFSKYHALGNDFIVLDKSKTRLSKQSLPRLAREICQRRTGVGADGVLWLSSSRKADASVDVFNADGSWAEKSGNGLRIAGVHLAAGHRGKKQFEIETGTSVDTVTLLKKRTHGFLVRTELGRPDFAAASVPVKTKQRAVINSPMKLGGVKLPMTCLAVGNPHTVIVVDNFDFDWHSLGADLEHAPLFPNGTNVEFVKPLSRKRFRVAEWERGAGATGSSGTGAAAVTAAMVMLGLAERSCEIVFDLGSLHVTWNETTKILDLTGPVDAVMTGELEFK